jgi:hypothetical protein
MPFTNPPVKKDGIIWQFLVKLNIIYESAGTIQSAAPTMEYHHLIRYNELRIDNALALKKQLSGVISLRRVSFGKEA